MVCFCILRLIANRHEEKRGDFLNKSGPDEEAAEVHGILGRQTPACVNALNSQLTLKGSASTVRFAALEEQVRQSTPRHRM